MKHKLSSFAVKYAMPLVLLCLVLLMNFIRPDANLLSWDNIKTILLQTCVLGFLALGLSFVMISGESDISFAGTLGMMSATFTLLSNGGMAFPLVILIVILIGVAYGLLISVLVTRGGFSAFIISIAVMFMGMGIERSYNEGVTIWLQPDSIKAIGRMQFGNVYILTWVMLVLYVIAFFVVRSTLFGFQLRMVGENRLASIEAGVKDRKIKILAFIIAGALYAVASATESIRIGGSIVSAGQSYMLPALTACYLGSTMFTPGRVNIAGSLVGALFMNIISNFMQLMNMQYFFTPLAQGLVLLLAVGISVFKHRHEIQQCLV